MNSKQMWGAVVELDRSELGVVRELVCNTPDEAEVEKVVRSFEEYEKALAGRAIIDDLYLGPTTASWIRLLTEERMRRPEYSNDYRARHLYREFKHYYFALYPERPALKRLELRGELG